MILSLAPMEGITGHVFRRVHAECFGALDRYYTPFLMPKREAIFGKRDRKEIDPETNLGLNVIPQVLTKHIDDFIAAAQRLKEMGYDEVNFNLGCPSGTVANKGKGSGFLAKPQELEAFLQEACEKSPLPVSVKTRLGMEDDAEYDAILEMYCRLPLAELILHPRIRKDFYQGSPRWEPYGKTLQAAPFPVAYNGDIFSVQDMDALMEAFPKTQHVMIGRGILTNPALARMIKGGPAASKQELKHFHDRLFQEYQVEMGGNAVQRMKEWWSYAQWAFDDQMAVKRAIRKTRSVDEYQGAVERVFAEVDLAENPIYQQ